MLLFCKLHAKLNLLYEYEKQEDVKSHVLGIAEPREQPNINCQAQGSESHPLIIHNLHAFLAISSSEERTDNIWQLLGNTDFVTPDKTVYVFATSQALCSTHGSSWTASQTSHVRGWESSVRPLWNLMKWWDLYWHCWEVTVPHKPSQWFQLLNSCSLLSEKASSFPFFCWLLFVKSSRWVCMVVVFWQLFQERNGQSWGIWVFLDCLIEGLQQQLLTALPSHPKDGKSILNEKLLSHSLYIYRRWFYDDCCF